MEEFLQTDFLQPANGALLIGILFSVIFLRYVLISGAYHYFVFMLFGNLNIQRKTHDGSTKHRQILKEIYWSGISSLIFALTGYGMVVGWQKGLTSIYIPLDTYGYWYLPVSLLIAMFIHETCYYWLHRWMHKPRIFKRLHRVHHESTHTNSWTSFSFHPLESLLQAIIVPIIVFFVPLNIFVILFFLILMSVSAVVNHAGIEVFPKGFNHHWLGKWLIGATHHDIHHKKFKYNFGLYFTFWDRWMQTESPDYDQQFDLKTASKNATKS